MKSLFLILNIALSLILFEREDIDYHHKRLLNGLKKYEVSGFSVLEEIKFNQQESTEVNGKFFKITEKNNNKVKYVFVGRVNSCRAGGCSVPGNTAPDLESEYFDYFIFFNAAKEVIYVEVYNYQATHGYEITAKGWLKQFIGFDGRDTLMVEKNIDGISGATVSVYAITNDIQQKTKILNYVK